MLISKKLRALLFMLVVVLSSDFCRGAEPAEGKTFTPYFNMTLAESAYVPSQGNIFSGGIIDTQLGMLARINERNSISGLYNFKYLGPAFQPQDGRQFQERNLDHIFNFEYKYAADEFLTLRPGFAYTKGMTRSGANEAWENGLYNMNSVGGQLAADYRLDFKDKECLLTAQYLLRKLSFPNYTDLLTEFEGANSSSELGGGLQDQKLQQLMVRVSAGDFHASASYSLMNYVNQTVVTSAGTYGSEKQKDNYTDLLLGFEKKIGAVYFHPSAEYVLFRSNQNFLRFKYFGAEPSDITDPSGDVTFVADAYSYNQATLDLPAEFKLSSGSVWTYSGGINLVRRSYVSRPPRDADNNYLSGKKQQNLLLRLSCGAAKKINELATVRFTYSFVMAQSNNKFERYLPYNYTGHSFGLAYTLAF